MSSLNFVAIYPKMPNVLCFRPSTGRIIIQPMDVTEWRVGHVGRDMMYYEEFCDGEWRRMPIDGEMLTGRAHHVIYISWLRFPDWANGRETEIVERIKREFREPDYEYQ